MAGCSFDWGVRPEHGFMQDALKERLIEDINKLLEPVRAHFKTDDRARELLEKVTAWRRETLTPTVSLTRLSTLDASLSEVLAEL
eukprot:4353358-Amphidinium_carterae.1